LFVSPYVSIRLNYRLLITSSEGRAGWGRGEGSRGRSEVGSTRNRAQESLLGRAASRRRKTSTIALRLRRPRLSLLPPGFSDSLVTGRELSASKAGEGARVHAIDAMARSHVSCVQAADGPASRLRIFQGGSSQLVV